MFYELYIDVFFLVNFMMDYILLMITKKVLKCSATHGRVCLGAALGAFLTCLVVVIPTGNAVVKFILFHGVVNIVMIQTGLGIGWNRMLLRAYLLLYVCAFLLGGVMEAFHPYIKTGSLFFALAIVGYYGSLGIWNLFTWMAERNERYCKVRLYKNGQEVTVNAIVDTGNCLKDGLTGKPVSVISENAAKLLCSDGDIIRYIPYHSIGKKEGAMPLIQLDRICICRKEEAWVDSPLAAICEEEITEDDYEMLLHPELCQVI